MGNKGWFYKDILPSFISFEKYDAPDGDTGYHGFNGQFHVNHTEPTFYTSLYIQALEELGLKKIDYNGREQIGVSPTLSSINGIKISSGGRAFIDPVSRQRANLHVVLNAYVTKVLFRGERARGVSFVRNGYRYIARTSKEIILSAGSINTPQILLLSGIGPQNELAKLGINSLVNLPVGHNLQDHPTYMGLNFRTNTTLFNDTGSISGLLFTGSTTFNCCIQCRL